MSALIGSLLAKLPFKEEAMFTHGGTTLTFKGLFHIPLCTWIEEGDRFPGINVSQRSCVPLLFVRGCEVKGDVRLARVVR